MEKNWQDSKKELHEYLFGENAFFQNVFMPVVFIVTILIFCLYGVNKVGNEFEKGLKGVYKSHIGVVENVEIKHIPGSFLNSAEDYVVVYFADGTIHEYNGTLRDQKIRIGKENEIQSNKFNEILAIKISQN